jgi:hypothetical protein
MRERGWTRADVFLSASASRAFAMKFFFLLTNTRRSVGAPEPDGSLKTVVRAKIEDHNMYSTFLTTSPGSVLFDLLKRKDLCFSCLNLARDGV